MEYKIFRQGIQLQYSRINLTHLFLYALIVLSLLACSSSGTTESVSIDVFIDGENMNPRDVVVSHSDLLVMNITSDRPGSIHIHGYNLEHPVEPGIGSSFEMEAYATGKFNIAFHNADQGHNHAAVHDHEDCKVSAGDIKPALGMTVEFEHSVRSGYNTDIKVHTDNIDLSPTGDHWHLYVDKVLMGMYSSGEISLNLEGVEDLDKDSIRITLNNAEHCIYDDFEPEIIFFGDSDHGKHADHDEHADHDKHADHDEVIIGSLTVRPD